MEILFSSLYAGTMMDKYLLAGLLGSSKGIDFSSAGS